MTDCWGDDEVADLSISCLTGGDGWSARKADVQDNLPPACEDAPQRLACLTWQTKSINFAILRNQVTAENGRWEYFWVFLVVIYIEEMPWPTFLICQGFCTLSEQQFKEESVLMAFYSISAHRSLLSREPGAFLTLNNAMCLVHCSTVCCALDGVYCPGPHWWAT